MRPGRIHKPPWVDECAVLLTADSFAELGTVADQTTKSEERLAERLRADTGPPGRCKCRSLEECLLQATPDQLLPALHTVFVGALQLASLRMSPETGTTAHSERPVAGQAACPVNGRRRHLRRRRNCGQSTRKPWTAEEIEHLETLLIDNELSVPETVKEFLAKFPRRRSDAAIKGFIYRKLMDANGQPRRLE